MTQLIRVLRVLRQMLLNDARWHWEDWINCWANFLVDLQWASLFVELEFDFCWLNRCAAYILHIFVTRVCRFVKYCWTYCQRSHWANDKFQGTSGANGMLRKIVLVSAWNWHSHWIWMVGKWSFLLGWPIFRDYLSLREGIDLVLLQRLLAEWLSSKFLYKMVGPVFLKRWQSTYDDVFFGSSLITNILGHYYLFYAWELFTKTVIEATVTGIGWKS